MAIHFDTQGPCPNGYHIPTLTEVQNLISTVSTLNALTNFVSYYKVPKVRCLDYSSGQPGAGRMYSFRTSTQYSPNEAQTFYSNGTGASTYFYAKSLGDPVRPFKDKVVIPDNNRTIIYDGSAVASGAGIFWNETAGIISTSSDGINRITISDKNIGAEQLNEVGYHYQRGNNYGFPNTGATNVDGTKIDASTYGPGNYYNSSTFITSYSWDSSYNANLRGGVTNGTRGYPDMRLHGAIQTFHFKPELLDISELKEFPAEQGLFSTSPNVYGIVEELNKYPQVYYAKFLGENNLYSVYGKTNVLGDGEGSAYTVTETFKGEPYIYMAFYDTETMKRDVYSKSGGLSTDV